MYNKMIHPTSDGYVIAVPVKKGSFRCTHTKTGKTVEATSIEDLKGAKVYKNEESAKRAIRKARHVHA